MVKSPSRERSNTNTNTNNASSEEEKDMSNETSELSFCLGLSKTPLAVPMIAESLDKSVTRNDAKAITETRLKRLKLLSQRPEAQLSKDQQHEKKRIIRLEKNRRAAAMSRRKKKMYVKTLEDRCSLMARHLAMLEMENARLRSFVSMQHPIPAPHQFPNFKFPTNMTFPAPSNFDNSSSESPNATNSVEPIEMPCPKKRKLNNGSSMDAHAVMSPSPSRDGSSDIMLLEPLPIPLDGISEKNDTNQLTHEDMSHMNQNESHFPFSLSSQISSDEAVPRRLFYDKYENENNDIPPRIEMNETASHSNEMLPMMDRDLIREMSYE